jgi:membrane protein
VGALLGELEQLIGSRGAEAIQSILASAHDLEGGLISLAIGAFTLFIGATTVFAELQSSLDRIWRAKPAAGGVRGLVKTRLIAFGLVVGVGFLLLVSLAVNTAITAVGTLLGSRFHQTEMVLQLVNIAISFGVITALFALIYKVLPNVAIAWRDVWLGAAVTSLLFSLGKFLIGLYIGTSAISSSFGAAGALVVLMVWVYYSAQIFFLGAEFTYAYACRHGSLAQRAAAGGQTPRARVARQ